MVFGFSESEFWECGLDQFNACVTGHNRHNGGEEKQEAPGLPAWTKGGKARG